MNILNIRNTPLLDIKIITFQRFLDNRGYFTESFRRNDLLENPTLPFLQNIEIHQVNESFSEKNVIRGLHFQWNPFMGKLIRVISGKMIDAFLDIRKGSPTFGKIGLHQMQTEKTDETTEWIWLPPGFAHGCCFLEPSIIEYFCSGTYSPGCEAGISPLSEDLDWSLCEKTVMEKFQSTLHSTDLITEKDRNGFSLTSWQNTPESGYFVYSDGGNYRGEHSQLC